MKYSAVFASSLAAALLAIGAVDALANEAKPQAPELTLDSLMAEMAKTKAVVAKFRERKEIALLVAPLESRGWLYFAPPGRLARFTLEPSYSSLVIDGDALRFRDGKDGEEFDMSGNPMARAFVDNFIVLFNGDVERLRELYETEFSTEGHSWTLRLTPRSQRLRGAIASVVLTGGTEASGQGGIRQMELHSSDGDRTTTDLETRPRDRPFSESELETLFSQRLPLHDTPSLQ